MLRVGTIYAVPSGVLTANHVVMHTFMGRKVYTNGVGIKSVCLFEVSDDLKATNEQRPDTPLSFCVVHNLIKLTSLALGI